VSWLKGTSQRGGKEKKKRSRRKRGKGALSLRKTKKDQNFVGSKDVGLRGKGGLRR